MIRALFPGTFDPIHYGHIDIAYRGAKMFDELIVAVYDRPLKHLLFSPETRLEMAKTSFADMPNIIVTGYSGLTIDFCRKINAQVIVRGLRVFSDFELEFRMAHANHRLNPNIEMMALITSDEHIFLSSTTVREISSLGGDVSSMVPPHVNEMLKLKFRDLVDTQQLVPMTALRD